MSASMINSSIAPEDVDNSYEVVVTMVKILATMIAVIFGLIRIQTPHNHQGHWLPSKTQPSKYAYEIYCAKYTIIWITIFAVTVVFRLYEHFTTASHYNIFCGMLALPFFFQSGGTSPDASRSFFSRYSTKANVWIATYSFIGNYWYTHYFYSILKASYTMPATRLNDVPIAMYFATHFYFSSYHVLSNSVLRKIKTTFIPNYQRTILFWTIVVFMAYFTAFMETLTISSFPYYNFQDQSYAYKIGSAFYGIYFLVSFPAFVAFDNDVDVIDDQKIKFRPTTCWDAFVQSCGYGMIILCLLDFVRLYLGETFIMK